MRRREFIRLFGGAAAIPTAARAQQSERVRRIGVLMYLAEDDPGGKARMAAFIEGLQQLDWTIGRNVQIDIRWGAAEAVRSCKYAAELATSAPDVIVATASETTAALREATRTLPIVFVGVTDPVGAGYVASLARPGGNATGFTFVEYGIGGKWLELLKEIAPDTTPIDVRDAGEIERAIADFARSPNSGLVVTPQSRGDRKS